jgi:hypothetical protein
MFPHQQGIAIFGDACSNVGIMLSADALPMWASATTGGDWVGIVKIMRD